MARAPSFDFERRERQKAKAAKKAEKAEAKGRKKNAGANETDALALESISTDSAVKK